MVLSVFNELRAMHGLSDNPTPHLHLWKIRADFKSPFPIQGDRVIDLVLAQSVINEVLQPLQGKFLNDLMDASPTSENLCSWIWDRLEQKLPAVPLHAVMVTLCDSTGVPFGRASLTR